MSSSIPSLSGRDVVRAFEHLGFVLDRIKGSHHILVKAGHPHLLAVPVHGSQVVKRGTLKSLIDASGVTREEFVAATKK
jgi:predicted RNA binding protein YcfA (HicA-like mRNA interferase family)